MKILVPVKRVPDPDVKIKLKKDGSGIDTEGLKFVINPFDEIAVEEAIRIKEKLGDVEIVVVSIGGEEATEQLRTAMAMGADRAILVVHPDYIDPANVAAILAKVVEKEQPDLIIAGKQAVDDDLGQAMQMLAEILDYPQATFASKVDIDGTKVTVVREVDGGLATVEFDMPGIITAELRLNEPRYASLPGIMKAKRKPLDKLTPADLGVEVSAKLVVKGMSEPPARKAGKIVESVDELVKLLHEEAKVI